MQYLSKAYNYYSGINPATLSGAIDVIVVRHIDAEGNVVLASSPFHVRFGKLQVLRAAEKRVTIKMPNNLPSPHIAPFSMKVGETGEAFFVLETTDDVPEELLTSPVVMPTEDPLDDPAGDASSSPTASGSLTKEPFGDTERQHVHKDVEFLDLNDRQPSSSDLDHPPPNPLQARPGESTHFPSRNDKLSHRNSTESPFAPLQDDLPKVKPGEGEGPKVVYGKEVVLDIAGYHSASSSSALETFTKDLIEAINHRPALTHGHRTEPSVPRASTPLDISDTASASELELETPSRSDRGRSEPPPDMLSPPKIPRCTTRVSSSTMDLAWDWSRAPKRSQTEDVDHPVSRHQRADSMSDLELAEDTVRISSASDPYLYTLAGSSGTTHEFQLALCGSEAYAVTGRANSEEESMFMQSRVPFRRFMEDSKVVEDSRLVMKYGTEYFKASSDVVKALAALRRSLVSVKAADPSPAGSWSRWWKKEAQVEHPVEQPLERPIERPVEQPEKADGVTHFAKTLRLSSEQLKSLNLQPGPNTVQFSVTSSYSGLATCTARIFLWEDTDQIVISDIDGTITKSDALGHVFAAIGRDWTHLGIAKLYTDICNNGYKMLYLTSRAIGQADSTREYLKTIIQGDYRLPEGPVIMSPDRLMASLHREVIMRKPELFKMACLRDIQRLFGSKAIEAFFAGFGNRITDAMSYRSVGVPTSKIYTIDSTGVVKTELLQSAGHKGSYVALNDLVNEVFPPVRTKFKPEFTDFNYWRADIPSVPLPDLSPPSPALSARSDSSRYSMLGKIIGRKSSKQPLLPTSEPSSRPSSPLIEPAITPDNLSEIDDRSVSSMPGSFESHGQYMPHGKQLDEDAKDDGTKDGRDLERGDIRNDSFDDDAIFDDDILATGEMKNVPF